MECPTSSMPCPSRSVPNLGTVISSEVEAQLVAAHRFPRRITLFAERAEAMACLNEDIADACMYALPRAGKTIEGPSARFAEIMATCWGNLRAEARPLEVRDRDVLVRGTCWDLESNVAIAFEVTRRITNREGKRFDDDMIAVTTNAAGSIALRNAILKVVPKAYWDPITRRSAKSPSAPSSPSSPAATRCSATSRSWA